MIDTSGIENIYNKFIIFISLIISIYYIYLLLSLTNYGMDLTDEGYHLISISNPYNYKSSVSQFGFFYHPLYILADENVANLRKINLFLYFLLSYLLIFLLFKPLTKSIRFNFFTLQILLIGFSLFVFLSLHTFTPHYHSLTLKGFLVLSIGVLILESHKKLIGCILISCGALMVFMGKPSSAALLAFVMFFYLITKKNSFNLIFLCSAFSSVLIFICSFLIDGSLILFIERIFLEIQHFQLLKAGYSNNSLAKSMVVITARPDLQNIFAILYTFLSILSIILILKFFFFLRFNNLKYTSLTKIIFALILLIFFVFIYLNYIEWFLIFERYQRLQTFAVLLFSIFVISYYCKFNFIEIIKSFNLRLVILFLIIPYIYAFGSNINLFKKSLDAGIFYLFASFIILIPFFIKNKDINNLFIFLIVGQIITATHINSIIENPYRQFNSLKSYNSILKINNKGNDLKLPEDRAKYIRNMKDLAVKAGLSDKKYVLDLTGQSSGLIYLLNSYSLGAGWMIGGYPGALDWATAKLDLVNCDDISNSWILYDQHSRRIPLDLLSSYGANFTLDYQEAAAWQAKEFSGNFEQKLFKPRNPPEILKKCKKIRLKERYAD